MVQRFRGYDGIGVSIFIPYRGTELRQYAVEHNLMDPSWISSTGLLDGGSILRQPDEYPKPEEITRFAERFKYYAFFGYQKEIDLAEDLDTYETIYNEKFYSKTPVGGIENIARRVKACEPSETVRF